MSFHEQPHEIGHDLRPHRPPAVLADLRTDQLPTTGSHPTARGRAAVPPPPHDVTAEVEYATSRNPHFPNHVGDNTHRLCHTTRFPAA
jgi:hypothetical protein